MMQSFIEENQEKHSVSCAHNCFNGNFDDGYDTKLHALSDSSSGEVYETLKGLMACPNVYERILLAEIIKIFEKNKTACKREDDNYRKTINDGLLNLGYDASICKSRWEKSTLCIAGEDEYIDVIMGKERVDDGRRREAKATERMTTPDWLLHGRTAQLVLALGFLHFIFQIEFWVWA